MYLLKNIKADFIQVRRGNEVLPCGGEMGLISKYNKEKWEGRADEG